MYKKFKKWILWGALLLVAGGSFAAASQPDFLIGKNIQILFNMFRDVSLFYVDSVDADRLLENAAAGMVSELDPYTELIPEKEMADFEIQATGKYAGIGAIIRKSGDYVMIAQPYKNFPADKAGLVIGDKIVAIDGESIKAYDATKVSGMLKGTPGTSVKLTVEKLLTGEQVDVDIKRERIVISGVPYYGVIDGDVGYILHNDFSEDCSQDLLAAFEALKKEGITSLIIDLRGNGGGILQEAVKILSMFVPKGTTVVSMKGRSEDSNATFVTKTDPVDTEIPIVVLVNSMTASAAEIVSGALQDLDRAVLVGQRTFGKGLVQVTRPLGYNAYLKVTTAKYYIPSGRCIQSVDYAHRNEDGSVGVVPDSLIREYTTTAGRKVYDGGGVMPDVRLDPNYTSVFTMSLYAKGYIEDFANDYYKRHREGIDVDTFSLSDEEYGRFEAFMADKEVEYDSETQEALKELRRKAEREKYADRITEELDRIADKLKEDKEADLESFKDDIRKLLEKEILLRYHYYEGVARHVSLNDPEVRRAIEILKNGEEYRRILTSQDTPRNVE